MRRALLLLWVCIALCETGHARQESDGVRIYYRQGYRTLDTLYHDNYIVLQRFVPLLGRAGKAGEIDSIEVCSYASPDGSALMNKRLAGLRADSLVAYLVRRTGLPEELFKKRPDGAGWGLLREMVAESDMQYRREVLEIIDHTPEWIYDEEGKIVDGLKKRLMDLHGGAPYFYMREHFFPDLRSCSAVLLHLKEGAKTLAEYVAESEAAKADSSVAEDPKLPVTETPLTGKSDESAMSGQVKQESVSAAPVDEEEGDEPLHRLAVKTNLLYDVLLMPSLEVEYRINDRWSVNLEGDMAWWKKKSKHKYYQLAMVSPEARYWFKTKKPWHGHYVGAFVGGGWFDLENGKRGYQGEGVMGGLSYGYMFPVTRVLSFEAGIGVGYLHTKYEEYLPEPGGHYLYQQTSKTDYFGPLKLKFALVWRLWDLNKKKGGMQ